MIFSRKTIEDLLSVEKEFVCFGSGKAFDKFVELFDTYNLSDKIRYVIDNDNRKQGTSIELGNTNILIQSPEAFLEDINPRNCIGIITMKDKEAILKQYEHNVLLRNLEVVWYYDLMCDYCTKVFATVNLKMPLRRSVMIQIPKVIHYCWFGGRDIPDENKKWMDSWKKHCPDYEIKRWDETNYDVSKNPYMYDAYQRKRFGFATDYARLDILYENGGVYLDTDVELVKSLDTLLYQPAFMGWEDGLRVNTGLGFGTIKGIPLFREMRDAYDKISFTNKYGKDNLTACPTFQTNVLMKHGLQRNGEYQVIEDIAILPVTYLCGQNCYVTHSTRTIYTYGIHHFQGSWNYTD